jgi:hypothetical protein
MDLFKRLNWTLIISWIIIAGITSIWIKALYEAFIYYAPKLLMLINTKQFSLKLFLTAVAISICTGVWFAFKEGIFKKNLQQ